MFAIRSNITWKKNPLGNVNQIWTHEKEMLSILKYSENYSMWFF
jgi:hypothetical protein